MLRGIDVSDWQPGIDWAAVATECQFAFVKATEGVGNVQDTFPTYRAEMAGAGLAIRGLYHFARPENGNPTGEADHFCDVVGSLNPGEVVVLDIETGDPSSWPQFMDSWFGAVNARLNHPPQCVYMSESPARSMPSWVAVIPLWVAGYVADPVLNAPTEWQDWRVGPWPSPIIWQWTSDGRVAGYGGRVDCNIAPDDLAARLGLSPNQPPEEDDVALAPDEHDAIKTTAAVLARICGPLGVDNGDPDTGGDVYSGARRLGQLLDHIATGAGIAKPTQ